MYINELSPVEGSTHVAKRKGRGHATGNGKTAGRGHKGQKARSGGVAAQALLDAGILSKCRYGVKILGRGEVTKKLTVKASAFSESAKEKIEAAGGKAEVV